MKKLFLIVVMLFTMTLYSFADDTTASKLAEAKKYELKINHKKLACALNVASDKIDEFNDIMTEFESDTDFASSIADEKVCHKIFINSVIKNIRYMRGILDERQYRNYLVVLNLTLNNKGFNAADFDVSNGN